MKKTIKISNGKNVNVGNVQAQLVNNISSAISKSLSKKKKGDKKADNKNKKKNASDVIVKISSNIASKIDGINSMPPQTIVDVFNSIKKSDVIMTAVKQNKNLIVPNVLHASPEKTISKGIDKLSQTTKKFSPYETLTGLAHERPELIMMTDFLPLFNSNAYKGAKNSSVNFDSLRNRRDVTTDAFRFFEMQYMVRAMRYKNASKLLADLKSNNPIIKKEMRRRVDEFKNATNSLYDILQTFLLLIKDIEKVKSRLDVRSDIYKVDAVELSNSYVTKFSSNKNLISFVEKNLPQYNIDGLLVSLGYNADSVKHVYSSSKVWLQTMLELKTMFRTHSDKLVDETHIKRQDNKSAVDIAFASKEKFAFNNKLVKSLSLSEITDIGNDTKTLNKAMDFLENSYKELYTNIDFKTSEARIAALLNLVSKEYRYSAGLSQENVQTALQRYFNYSVNDRGNLKVFDSLIGQFGSNISDFSATTTKSLASLAQQQPAENVGVLTFESKYLEGDTGTLTPGSDYYVNSVLNIGSSQDKFTTAKLEDLDTLLKQTNDYFSYVVNGMNLMMNNPATGDVDEQKMKTTLSNPRSLFSFLYDILFNAEKKIIRPKLSNDPVSSIFQLAAKNTKIRVLLFTLVMNRLASQNKSKQNIELNTDSDKTATINNISGFLIKEIDKDLKQLSNKNEAKKGNSSISNIDLFKLLNSDDSDVINAAEEFMRAILGQFQADDKGILNEFTRYSGVSDTSVMLATFDLFVNSLNKYCDSKFVNTSTSKGLRTYNIYLEKDTSKKYVERKQSSVATVKEKVLHEIITTQKLIFYAFNVMTKLSNSTSNLLNYLKSEDTIKVLGKLIDLFDDKSKVEMLLSTQQLSLLVSTLQDILMQFKSTSFHNIPRDFDGDGKTYIDPDDEFVMLDDSLMNSTLLNCLTSYLATSRFSSTKSANKKILTVGLPIGFSYLLKQKVNIGNLKRTSFANKESDIVKVCVYKVDLENQDLIFKPRKFLFELSRFPVRNSVEIRHKPDEKFNSVREIINTLPTRDLTDDDTKEMVEFRRPQENERKAFTDESYNFLSEEQKDEIHENHVVSYMLESYLNIMTGMSVGEHNFSLSEDDEVIEPEFIDLISVHHVQKIVSTQNLLPKKTTNKKEEAVSQPSLFSFSDPEPQDPPPPLSKLLPLISKKRMPMLFDSAITISNMSKFKTPLMKGLKFSKNMVQPKQFDRVFNVIVDPDEFEIDYDKTMLNPRGKMIFDQMLKKGDIIAANKQTSSTQNIDNTTYVCKEKDKNEGDLLFEKYFITIETAGSEAV